MRIFSRIVLTVNWVCCGDNTTSGVERCVDSSFGDCDSLLFHYFVDCHSVNVAHFIEFFDTYDSSVGEDHCSCFETTFAGFFVCCNCSCETDAGGPSSSCGNGQGSSIQYESKHLRFGSRWVADHENVDIPKVSKDSNQDVPSNVSSIVFEILLASSQ